MAKLVKLLLSLVVGLGLGIGLMALTTRSQPLLGAVHSGAWTAWPLAGSPKADPYARASFARDGQVPLASAVGLRFFARKDDGGAALDRRCSYAVGGPTPAAQFWTLTLLRPDGSTDAGPATRSGFTSAELLRSGDGEFTITVAGSARPGNWLPSSGTGRFELMLSFYDTPLSTAISTGAAVPPLPSIVKTACS